MWFFWLFQTVSESSERMEGGSSLGRFIQAEALEMAYCLGAAWVTVCQKGLWRHDLTTRSLALPTPLCPPLKIGAKQMPRLHFLPFIGSLPWPHDLYWASLDLLSSSSWFMSVSDKEFFSPDLPPLAYSTPATWGHCSSLCQQASLALGIFSYLFCLGALPTDSSVSFPTSSAPMSLSWGGLSSCTICKTILSTLYPQHSLPFWTYFSVSSSRRFLL